MSPNRFGTRVVAGGIIGLALWAQTTRAAAPIPVDRIQVRVGNEIITTLEIEEPLRQLRERLSREFSGDELERRMEIARREHRQRLIEEKLLLLEARAQKLEVTDAQVTERADEEIAALRAQFPESGAFEAQLAKEHLTLADLRAQRERLTREQMLRQRLLQGKTQEFTTGVDVTEEQLQAFYKEHAADFKRAARVKISQIFVARPDAGLPADRFAQEDRQARAKIEQAQAELSQGKPFGSVARKYSEHRATAEQGGEVGWLESGDVGLPEFDEVVFKAPAGGLTPVIGTARGFFLVKVEDRQEGGTQPIEEVRGRIRQTLMNESSESRYRAWIETLKKKYEVVEAAEPKS